MDLTKEEEDELLEALWSIIVQFVNMGFGIEPVQRALLDAPSMETPMMNGSNNSKKDVK